MHKVSNRPISAARNRSGGRTEPPVPQIQADAVNILFFLRLPLPRRHCLSRPSGIHILHLSRLVFGISSTSQFLPCAPDSAPAGSGSSTGLRQPEAPHKALLPDRSGNADPLRTLKFLCQPPDTLFSPASACTIPFSDQESSLCKLPRNSGNFVKAKDTARSVFFFPAALQQKGM